MEQENRKRARTNYFSEVRTHSSRSMRVLLVIRYYPVIREEGGVPFTLDCLRPTLPLADYPRRE
jgi:hypothetical protein